MGAQVSELTEAGIPACFVGSAQPDPNILSRIRKGEFILYSSPEFLQTTNGKQMLDILQKRLLLVAIGGKS